MGQFFDELKRRNVLRVAIAYLVASWLLIQIVETLFPVFGLHTIAALPCRELGLHRLPLVNSRPGH